MTIRPRWRRWLGWEIAAAVVVVLIATTLLLARNLSTRPGEPVASPPDRHAVDRRAVDDTAAGARRQDRQCGCGAPADRARRGRRDVGRASRGGLTRLLAVYSTNLATVISPVRSARSTDLQFGTVPLLGTPSIMHRVDYQAAEFTFTWSPNVRRWLVSMDGSPLLSTESGLVSAATVVEQRVTVTTQEYAEDALGSISPVAQTVGSGPATMLRDGQRFDATWSRPTPKAPTRFPHRGRPTPAAGIRSGLDPADPGMTRGSQRLVGRQLTVFSARFRLGAMCLLVEGGLHQPLRDVAES